MADRRQTGRWRQVLCLLGAIAPFLSAYDSVALATKLGPLVDYVLVASRGSSAVTVVDTRVDEVAASIPLPEPPDQYVVSAEARMLVASHRSRRALSMVSLDRATSTSLKLDFEPRQIDLDPDGRWLAVSSGAPGAVFLSPWRRDAPSIASGASLIPVL